MLMKKFKQIAAIKYSLPTDYVLLLWVIVAFCASQASSQEVTPRYYERNTLYPNGVLEIGALGMFTKYFGEFSDERFGYTIGMQSRYLMPFLPELGLGFRIAHGTIDYNRRFRPKFGDDFRRQFPVGLYPDALDFAQSRSTKYTVFDPLIFINIFPRSPINYYVFAGYSVMAFYPQEIESAPLSNQGIRLNYIDWKDEDNFSTHWTGGVGMDFYISRRVSIGAQFAFRNIQTDFLDGYAQIDENGIPTLPDNFIESGIKLSAYFFNDDDVDNDGIDNETEEKMGLNPFSVDSDDDGMSDYDEIYVYKTNALSNDTDLDGIPDIVEITKYFTDPTKKDTDDDSLSDADEVAIFFTNPRAADTDTDSLPDAEEIRIGTNPLTPDTDGDNIPDALDKCPKLSGLNTYDGCPAPQKFDTLIVRDTVIREKITIKEGQSYSPFGINFETAKAEIKPESEIILDDVAQWLKKNPSIIVEIRGHTDATGTAEANNSLSELRALEVMKYLILNGISAKRLSAVGYGSSKPISDNTTEKGKAKNRRIEFFVKKSD